MKIVLYVHCFFPSHFYGTETYTLTLAKNLAVLGHEPVIVSAVFAGEPRQERLVDIYEWDGIPVYSIDKNRYIHRSIKETYSQPDLRHVHERILRRIQPDAVHVCHLVNHTTAVLDVTAAMNIPTFATLTDFFGFCLNNKLEAASGALCTGPSSSRANCIACHVKAASLTPGASPAFRRLNHPLLRPVISRWLATRKRSTDHKSRFGFEPADIVDRPGDLRNAMRVYRAAVAPSAFLREAYLRNGFPAPLVLSHFGVDIDRAIKPEPPHPGRVRLTYVGQIAPHKGVHVLLEALEAAARPNLHLAIWGPNNQDAAYYDALRRRAAGLPVTFCGTFASERMHAILAETDILVIPSTWYENSPLILLQALATHTPVVVSDVKGLTEFVPVGSMGFHFPRGDVEALARILIDLADDPELPRRLSQTTKYERLPIDMARDVEAMMLEPVREL